MKIKTTDSSKFNSCLVRKKRIADTPEERVRQSLLRKMIEELGFPKGLISVEREIGDRRYDLVCYTKEMTPLLLVECKAGALDEAAVKQAMGYNDVVKAPFVCLAGAHEITTLWHEQGRVASVPFLPLFEELYAISQRL